MKKILCWIFPITCAGCNALDTALCAVCKEKLKTFPSNELAGPFTAFEHLEAGGNGGQQALDGLAAIYIYKKSDLLAQILHLYKYEGMEAYGKALLKLTAGGCSPTLLSFIEEQIDFVTWVPLHEKKLRRRGFNQSREIALALPSSPPKVDFLKRIKNTVAQMSLSRHERLLNTKGVFALTTLCQNPFPLSSEEKHLTLKGKNVLLVDDVLTTGATLNSAAEVLKQAGANKVFGLVLARQED